MTVLQERDFVELKKAKSLLEYPSLTARISDFIGTPIDKGLKMLPVNWMEKVGDATKTALLKGLELSLKTMDRGNILESKDWLHKLLITASGAGGGAGGFLTLTVELPISTCLILRSIADIARSEGHDLELLEIRLSCLEVLALGGKRDTDDASESGYWAIRSMLGKAVYEAAAFISEKGVIEESAPPIVRLIIKIASRFNIIVSEEVAAKIIPGIGAVSGAVINLLFMDHFQDMARGHFIVKRLESKYGRDVVEEVYKNISV
jgi:hypothetical protein